MSQKELDRLGVIRAVTDRGLRQSAAAEQLGLSVRQVKRLVRQYRARGPEGLISGHRGRPPANTIAAAVREEAKATVRREYWDFGPTLAREKLAERHGIEVSVETLRQWMMEAGLWEAKRRKAARVHQRRPRRPCLGELVQIDGSPHAWFEARAPACTLIVFIDDATGRLLALRFAPAETTEVYMRTLKAVLGIYGRPAALYSDRHSIFRVNQADREGELTQFTRAIKTLDIEPIHAQTPQAKGRVERANQTLQDRLVKELRLRGISDIEAANAFVPEFIAAFNIRFAVTPQSELSAFRPVLHSDEALALIFSYHHTRKLSKNLTCQFKHREFQLEGYAKGYRLRGATVTVCEAFDGRCTLLHKGRTLNYRILAQGEPPIALADDKTLDQVIEQTLKRQAERAAWRPAPDHPWKRSFKASHPLSKR